MRAQLIALAAAACGFLSLADNVVYVAPTGSDSNDGSQGHPFLTVNKAVETLNETEGINETGGTVYLADGTYADELPVFTTANVVSNTAVVVTNAISIEGQSGDPSRVTVKRTAANGRFRLFYLNHASAALRYLTVSDGWNDNGKPGGGIYIGSAGGIVSDCVVESCKNGGNNANGGAGISMENGRVLRTIVRNCNADNMRNYGHGIYASGGVIDNCLVTGCRSSHHGSSCNGNAAVYLTGTAKMVNSTVTKNTSCLVSGVWIASDNAQAVNCAVYGNLLCSSSHNDGMTKFIGCFACKNHGTTVTPAHNAGLGDIYLNCASESEPYTASCIKLTSSPFADYDGSDYTHGVYSPLANTGDSALARSISASSADLYGNPRYSGAHVDIGAYEFPEGFAVYAYADKYSVVIPGGNPVSFTAESSGATAEVTYTWDFGDGESLETTETKVEHSYAAPGQYSVSVTASDGSGSDTYVFPQRVLVRSFSCDFAIVTTNVMVGASASFRVENIVGAAPQSYTWDFGDGVSETVSDLSASHVYAAAGKYGVSVVANGGAAGSLDYAFDTTVDVVQKDIYVNAAGSETFPFEIAAKGAKTPSVALSYAVDGCVVHVVPGEYDLRGKETKVMRGVRVVGEGEKPEETVFKGYGTNNGTRNIRVEHGNAWVENLTLDGGFADYSTGGNLYLGAGVVTNCILRNGRSNSNGGGGGGAFVKGGILTHCIITNSYLGNRGNGIALQQTGGRVSNCLIGYNKREWLNSRNAFSVVYVTGGIIDNCTIVGMALLKYNADVPFQMGGSSDTGVNVGTNGKAYNCALADFRYYRFSDGSHWAEYADESPSCWRGTAANFVNCVTDDAEAVNATCTASTTAGMFADYANGDRRPGTALRNAGAAIDGCAFPSVDLAGNKRVAGRAIDVGCYEDVSHALSIRIR